MFNKSSTKFSSGYFGKLPEFNDFIKFNAFSPEILFIDNWLQEGLAYAKLKFKSEWKENYYKLQPTGFFISVPSSENIAAGMLYAGKDKSSREFPFLIFSLIPGSNFDEYYLIPSELWQVFFKLDAILRIEDDISSLNLALKNYNVTLPQKESIKSDFKSYLSNTLINEFLIRTSLSHSIFNIKDMMYTDSTIIRISFSSDDNHFAFDAGFLIYLLNNKINLSFRHSSFFWNKNSDEQFQLIILPFNITAINFIDLLAIECNDKRGINLNAFSERPSEKNRLSEINSSLEEVIKFS